MPTSLTNLLTLSNIKWLAIGTLTMLFLWTQFLYREEKAGRALDAQTYATASVEAELKHEQAMHRLENKYEKDAKQADADLHGLVDKYNAAIMRAQANQRASGGPQSPANNRGPTVLDGPSEDTKLLISGEDAYICAENTARLKVSREWALKLNEPVK